MNPQSTRRCGASLVMILGVVLSGIFSLDVWADEILPIGRILSAAPSLAAHLVTFKGRIDSLEKVPSVPIKTCYMSSRYRALITDESGSIQAIICGRHLSATEEPRLGDVIVVRAVLELDTSPEANGRITAIGVRMERAWAE